MATTRQLLGQRGERVVSKLCKCAHCKRSGTLRLLPPNFKCADVICDFCGYLAQVKTASVRDVDKLPSAILGAAWGPRKERMDAGIYFPLFMVLVSKTHRYAIWYLPADAQTREMFKPRKPLNAAARRAGWRGFIYDLTTVKSAFIRLA